MFEFEYKTVILFSVLFINLLILTYSPRVTAQSLVPGIHGISTVQGVLFTWVIVSSENEISINLRYVGTSSPPPLLILATAYSNQNPITMGGSRVLNSSWISPSSMTIKVDGSTSLYDADLITVVASPYGSSSPSIPVPTMEAPVQTEAPSSDQSKCDSSYPDFCIPSPPPLLNCPDVPQKDFRVQGVDPHKFDLDKDGIGCDT